jgi:hypothetical protein
VKRLFLNHLFIYGTVIDIAFVKDERNLILKTVNVLFGSLILRVFSLQICQLLLQVVKVLARIRTVVIALNILQHGQSSISISHSFLLWRKTNRLMQFFMCEKGFVTNPRIYTKMHYNSKGA